MSDDQERPVDALYSNDRFQKVDQTRYRTEPELRAAVIRTLRACGIGVDAQVACAVGAADVVTSRRDVICEIKHELTRRALFQAVGQVLMYRQCINEHARAVIIGYATPETPPLLEAINALGVEVICWRDGRDRIWDEEPRQMPIMVRRATKLEWNIQAYAQSRGIVSVAQLSWATHISRQSIYPLWRDEAKSVSLALLGRLAKTLNANVGGWFGWEGIGADARLTWRIKEASAKAGVDHTTLSWRAEIYPTSLASILDDTAQAVFVLTLDKLARVLQLDTGDLLIWKEID